MRAGNENIHLMTSAERQILWVLLEYWDGKVRYAQYDNFRVGSEKQKYRLISLGKYKGTAGTLYGVTIHNVDRRPTGICHDLLLEPKFDKPDLVQSYCSWTLRNCNRNDFNCHELTAK